MTKGLKNTAKPGDIYVRDDGTVYRVTGYQPSPTVHLEQLCGLSEFIEASGRREIHAVGSLDAEEFTFLGHTNKNVPSK